MTYDFVNLQKLENVQILVKQGVGDKWPNLFMKSEQNLIQPKLPKILQVDLA